MIKTLEDIQTPDPNGNALIDETYLSSLKVSKELSSGPIEK